MKLERWLNPLYNIPEDMVSNMRKLASLVPIRLDDDPTFKEARNRLSMKFPELDLPESTQCFDYNEMIKHILENLG